MDDYNDYVHNNLSKETSYGSISTPYGGVLGIDVG